MDTLLITMVIFMTAFAGMAIGVILSNKVIKGSCGGIGAIMGKSACDVCALKDKCESSGKELCEEGHEDGPTRGEEECSTKGSC